MHAPAVPAGEHEALPPLTVPSTWTPDRLLSADRVANFLGVGKRTVWRYVQRGILAPPRRFTIKIVRWTVADIVGALDAVASAQRPARRQRTLFTAEEVRHAVTDAVRKALAERPG